MGDPDHARPRGIHRGPEKPVPGYEDTSKQDGVRQVQAMTAVWTKPALWTTFFL